MNAQVAAPASGDRSDGALSFALGRVAAGDHAALEGVYRRTSAKLFAVCLDDLREDDADLIRTAFLEGATQPDLAVSRSLPLGAVKTRIRRALLELKACLA